jgi:hypothetical protein
MELLAERDPEEARAILDPVLERMMAAAHPRSQQASAAARKPVLTAVPGVRGFALD